jgi:hypothetical protein
MIHSIIDSDKKVTLKCPYSKRYEIFGTFFNNNNYLIS